MHCHWYAAKKHGKRLLWGIATSADGYGEDTIHSPRENVISCLLWTVQNWAAIDWRLRCRPVALQQWVYLQGSQLMHFEQHSWLDMQKMPFVIDNSRGEFDTEMELLSAPTLPSEEASIQGRGRPLLNLLQSCLFFLARPSKWSVFEVWKYLCWLKWMAFVSCHTTEWSQRFCMPQCARWSQYVLYLLKILSILFAASLWSATKLGLQLWTTWPGRNVTD